MSAEERTGWRCEAISRRHRVWGYNCPGVDLDFVMVEYNHGKPVALIEYKHIAARKPDLAKDKNLQALVALANGYSSPLPCIIARYDIDTWAFQVVPLNVPAQIHYAHVAPEEWLTERRFVRSIYLLRMKTLAKCDEAAIAKLNNSTPDE